MTINSMSGWDEVTTRADGSFTGTLTISQPDENGYLQYTYDNNRPGYGNAFSDLPVIGIDPRPTKLTIGVDRSTINAGEGVVASGRLTWRTRDGWVPIAGATTHVSRCDALDSCSYLASAVTDADGYWSTTVFPYGSGKLRAGYAVFDDPFVASATADKDVAVLSPAAFREFSAVRESATRVNLSGQLEFTGNRSPGTAPLKLQFSLTGEGGWSTIATVNASPNYSFSTPITKRAAGYWRAVYPGQAGGFVSATSAVIYVA
jgi:hypothetical protein